MLSAIAKQIVVEGIAGAATRKTRNISAGYGLYALAGGIGIIGVVFLAIAVYGLLLEQLSMPVAASITGAGILALSGILVAVGKSVSEKKRSLILDQEIKQVDVVVSQLMDDLMEEVGGPVRENPKMAMALAGLAGLVIGGRIH